MMPLTRSQSLPVGIFIANLKSGDWNEKKWRRKGMMGRKGRREIALHR